jgi:hypothetical protein
VVAGTVRNAQGGPVIGQRIQMSSRKARETYRATTDGQGRFVMEGVEVSDDYLLSINGLEDYQDYFEGNLRVTEAGLTLAIELKDKDMSKLRGQMVDVYGNPVPNFTLLLQTKETSYYNTHVVGDAVGAFVVENAPAGELRLRTESSPYHRIEGIRPVAGGEDYVLIVLDTGRGEIRGRVLDDKNYPVAVPNISLTWSYVQNGVRSTSRRTTTADAQGDFRFSQLGPGGHTLTINAPGYEPVRIDHDPAAQGSDVVVRLEKKETG